MGKLSPMMEQYLSIKKQHPDKILFFQVGDFYELFYDDAKTASRELDLVLTSRDGDRENRVPLAGLPMHAITNYLNRLLEKGYKVVICDQVEDAAQAKGLVKREVTRIVTPGTVTDQNLLSESSNNYVMALGDGGGMALADVSTGGFWATVIAGTEAPDIIKSEWQRVMPAECICHPALVGSQLLAECLQLAEKTIIEQVPAEYFSIDDAHRIIEEHWEKVHTYLPDAAVRATGALLRYIQNLQKTSLTHLQPLVFYYPGDYMLMDGITRRNLELTKTIREGKRKGTLLGILDNTCSAMGSRLLKRWIEQPLKDVEKIEERLDAVDELNHKKTLKDELRAILKKIYDLERLCGRVSFGHINARDLIALKETLNLLPDIRLLMEKSDTALLKGTGDKMPLFQELTGIIAAAIVDQPPLTLKEGGLIKAGYNREVDELRNICSRGKDWLLEMEKEEKEKTRIKSLKIGYNKVYGYYIEVTKTNLAQVPPHYHRKQTLVNAERYITEDLKNIEEQISGAGDKLAALEFSIFEEIKKLVNNHTSHIQEAARLLSRVDCLQALAETAAANHYCRPRPAVKNPLQITEGRHPVVEKMDDLTERFVPNDVFMSEKHKMAIITGPNMAGKSTYCRTVALICLMAQAGSFVPAESATLPVMDKIFARVGASDDLSAGQSTFMVEMSETASILKEATADSLIVLDEIGRGTSTYDGMSIARSVLEYINKNLKSWTLFSTHYHELTVMEDELPAVKNYTMAIREKGHQVIFLRKVIPGRADKSYGINVARLAGLPQAVVERAREILVETEGRAGRRTEPRRQISLFEFNESPGGLLSDEEKEVLEKIKALNPEQTTPLAALQFLFSLKEKVMK